MDRRDLEPFLEKRIKIVRNDGFFFTGRIESLGHDSLSFEDKFGKNLIIAFKGIASVEEMP